MEEVSIIIRALLKNWLKLLLLPVLSMAIVHHLIKDQPQKYSTEAKLFLNFQENKAISLGESEVKQYQILTYFQNITQLVQAEKTMNRVRWLVVQEALLDRGVFKPGNEALLAELESVRKRLEELPREDYQFHRDHPVDSLMMNYLDLHRVSHGRLTELTKASRIMDSNFLKFEFTEEDPDKTYLLATFIIQALIEENKRIAKSQVYSHKALIETLLDKAKADLDQRIKKLEDFKVSNNIINLGEHTKAIVTYLVNLEIQRGTELQKIAASQRGMQEVLATVEDGNELSVDLTANSEIIELKEKSKALVRKKMLASFEHNNLDSMAAIDEAIARSKEAITDKLVELAKNVAYDPSRLQMELANRYLGYDFDTEIATAIIDALDIEMKEAREYSKQFAPFESLIGTMEQEISTAQGVYLQLLNKFNITKSLEYGSGENVIEIVDPPQRPAQPLPSKQMLIIVGAGVAIFVLFAAVIVILHLLDASVSSVKKYERESSFKVVAAVPQRKEVKKPNLFTESVDLIHQQQIIHLAKAIQQGITPEEKVVILLSSQKDTQAHELAELIQQAAASDTFRVAVVNADWTAAEASESAHDLRDLFANGKTLVNEPQILEQMKTLRAEHDLVLVVASPSHLVADYRFWVEHYSKAIYIYRANQVYSKVDGRLENYLKEAEVDVIGAVLNQMDVESMEDFIGDVPKPRNKFRVFIKKVLRRDF